MALIGNLLPIRKVFGHVSPRSRNWFLVEGTRPQLSFEFNISSTNRQSSVIIITITDDHERMAPHEPPNGTPTRGRWEAPPSTMAAQLINNLSTKKPSRQIEHDDLQSLMTEVSSRENDPTDFTDPDAMLEHKHKLLYVIAKVVLERLNKDDPFMNVENVINQACEALEVIISTIKDGPSILNYVSSRARPLKTRGPEPFWMWLFPRVLSCLGHRNCKKLTAKIEIFFSTSFEVVARSPKLWGLNFNFFCYLKDSVSSK